MPAPKPTEGHPSRTAAVRAMRNNGLRNCEIARRLGISQSAVSGLLQESQRAAPTVRRLNREAGVLRPLEAAQTIHRSTEQEARRTVEIRLTDAEFACIVHLARAQMLTPARVATDAVRRLVAQFLEATS